jgi:hypothetical protein
MPLTRVRRSWLLTVSFLTNASAHRDPFNAVKPCLVSVESARFRERQGGVRGLALVGGILGARCACGAFDHLPTPTHSPILPDHAR